MLLESPLKSTGPHTFQQKPVYNTCFGITHSFSSEKGVFVLEECSLSFQVCHGGAGDACPVLEADLAAVEELTEVQM